LTGTPNLVAQVGEFARRLIPDRTHAVIDG
jgi:hypothetical protein